MATSASGRDAHEFGGGAGGRSPANSPAMTVTSVRRPSSSALDVTRDVLVPQHREVRVDHLVGRRKVQPDLEQLARVRPGRVEQREHLAVDDAGAGGEPLHVAATEPGGGAERVGVVDEALAHEGDRLEATMRVLREPGNDVTVVHPPAVGTGEVHAEVARLERRRRARGARCPRGRGRGGGRRTGTDRPSPTGSPSGTVCSTGSGTDRRLGGSGCFPTCCRARAREPDHQ